MLPDDKPLLLLEKSPEIIMRSSLRIVNFPAAGAGRRKKAGERRL